MKSWFCIWNDLVNPKNGLNLVSNSFYKQDIISHFKGTKNKTMNNCISLILLLSLSLLSCKLDKNEKATKIIKNERPNEFNQNSKQLITKNKLGNFYLETDVRNIKSTDFESTKDTFYFDEDESKTELKICYYKNKEFIEFHSSENNIYDIRTNSKRFKTSENISIGNSFNQVINALKNNYQLIDDLNEITLLDRKNHLRLWFSNSDFDNFKYTEVNDLYKMKNSIPKEQGEKMKLIQIDLFLIQF
jgi:hypothetical protein